MNKRILNIYLITLAILLFLLISCQKPQLAYKSNNENGLVFTEGLNFERHNYLPKDINPPFQFDKKESLNGLATQTIGLFEDHLILTTHNGYLSVIPVENIGKNRKTRLSKGTTASPTLYNEKLYIPMEIGKSGLRVYNIKNADILWDLKGYYSKSSPIVIDNLVFHTSKYGNIICLNVNTGSIIWEVNLGDNIYSNLAYSAENLIAVTQNGIVQSFDPKSGLVLWNIKIDEAVHSQPLILNNVVYVITYNGNLYQISLKNGNSKLIKAFKGYQFSPLSTDGKYLYIPQSNGEIVTIEVSSKDNIWKLQLDGPVSSPVLVTNKYLLIGTAQKYFYILDKSNGEIIQSLQLEGRLSSLPVIHNEKIFLGYEYRHLACLTPGNKELSTSDEN